MYQSRSSSSTENNAASHELETIKGRGGLTRTGTGRNQRTLRPEPQGTGAQQQQQRAHTPRNNTSKSSNTQASKLTPYCTARTSMHAHGHPAWCMHACHAHLLSACTPISGQDWTSHLEHPRSACWCGPAPERCSNLLCCHEGLKGDGLSHCRPEASSTSGTLHQCTHLAGLAHLWVLAQQALYVAGQQ